MSELAIVLSGFIANLVTSWIKPPEGYQVSQESIDARKSLVRLINLVVGVISLVASAWLLGEPLDVSSLGDTISTIVSIVITFAFSQGAYHLAKK